MTTTIWEQAIENVREGAVSAALELEIDAYQVEMFLKSTEADYLESRAGDVRLEFFYGGEALTTETQNDARTKKLLYDFRRALEDNRDLGWNLAPLVRSFLEEELDYQTQIYLEARNPSYFRVPSATEGLAISA